VDLSGASHATIGDDQGTGTILNDDAVPAISIDDVSATEGDSGTSSFDFRVSLTSPSDQTVTVDHVRADGSATAGSDYAAGTGTATFAPGATTQTVSIVANGDTTFEPDETLIVNLSNPSNATARAAERSRTATSERIYRSPTPTAPIRSRWASTSPTPSR
jgi:hypothetical protein